MIESTIMPKSVCPSCGSVNDAATNPFEGGSPTAGDMAICFQCGTLCIFNNDLTLRLAMQKEIEMLSAGERRMIDQIEKARRLGRDQNSKQ